MQKADVNLKEQIVEEYSADLDKLLKYLPYFKDKKGSDVQDYYEGDGDQKVIPVPVYDSTLLAFVKEAGTTKFMNRNYPYAYRRWKMPTGKAECAAMESATLKDIDLFRGVLSKYVLEGRRKSYMWTKGVEEGVYVTALTRLKVLFSEYRIDRGDNR